MGLRPAIHIRGNLPGPAELSSKINSSQISEREMLHKEMATRIGP